MTELLLQTSLGTRVEARLVRDREEFHAPHVLDVEVGEALRRLVRVGAICEPAATDPLVQAIEAAVRAGIVVVVSAGNVGVNATTGQVGYAGITSPGNAPS